MAQSQPIPGQRGIPLQPPCPTCGVPMWLIRLSPYAKGQDLRTFKCQVCERTESMVVKFK
jgi:transposase-like protein